MTNEPDILYPYLFNYIEGEAWRAQNTVRKLRETHYKNAPDGIPGNDDCGTLSAWILFSMMGIYPNCPGSPQYAITTPAFDRIVIHLDSKHYRGGSFEIQYKRSGSGEGNITSMKHNRIPFEGYFIDHRDIVNGGVLEIRSGTANTNRP